MGAARMSNCTKGVLLLIGFFIWVTIARDLAWERRMECEIDNAIHWFAQQPGVTVDRSVNVPLDADCSGYDPYEGGP